MIGAERAAAGPSRARDPVFVAGARLLLPLGLRGAALSDRLDAAVRVRLRDRGSRGRDGARRLHGRPRGRRGGGGALRRDGAAAALGVRGARAGDRGSRPCRAGRDPRLDRARRAALRRQRRAAVGGGSDARLLLPGMRLRHSAGSHRVHGRDPAAAGARRRCGATTSSASRIGTLYAVNTAGAVAGTVVAAFVLLPWLGLTRTVLVGVGGERARVRPRGAGRARRERGGRASAPAPRRAIAGCAVARSCSCSSSRASPRSATRCSGRDSSATCSAARPTPSRPCSRPSSPASRSAPPSRRGWRRRRRARPAASRSRSSAIAAGSLAAFRAMDALPALALRLGAGRDPDQSRQRASLAALVMLPATLAIGATFPFAVRVLARGRADAAPASARVYAWNTVGAIVGALGSGFLLMPLLGYAGLVAAAAGVNLAARRSSWRSAPSAARALLAAVAALAGVALVVAPADDALDADRDLAARARTRARGRPSSSPSGGAPASPSARKGRLQAQDQRASRRRDAAAAPLSARDSRPLARRAAVAGAARRRAACWWSGSAPGRRWRRVSRDARRTSTSSSSSRG